MGVQDIISKRRRVFSFVFVGASGFRIVRDVWPGSPSINFTSPYAVGLRLGGSKIDVRRLKTLGSVRLQVPKTRLPHPKSQRRGPTCFISDYFGRSGMTAEPASLELDLGCQCCRVELGFMPPNVTSRSFQLQQPMLLMLPRRCMPAALHAGDVVPKALSCLLFRFA